jgi:hypothetical protein
MHSENRNAQEHCHRYAGKCHQSAYKNCQAAKQFGYYADPCHKMWRGNSQRLQNRGEAIRTSRYLRKTMLHETVADDQT